MSDFGTGVRACIEITEGCATLCRRDGRDGTARELAALVKLFRARADAEDTAKAPTPMCPDCGAPVSMRCTGCGWWPGAGVIRTDPTCP